MWLSDHPRPSQPGQTAVSTSLAHSSQWSFSPHNKQQTTAYKKTSHHKCSWGPVQTRPRSWSICSVSSLHLRSVLTQGPLQSSCAPKTHWWVSRGKSRAHNRKQREQTGPIPSSAYTCGAWSVNCCSSTAAEPFKHLPFSCNSGFSSKHCYRFCTL